MVIIRSTLHLNSEAMAHLIMEIETQAKRGVIVLPAWCELLNEVPADEEIKVIQQDTRVAELEKELATAMAYIFAAKDCETCKHEMRPGTSCPCECDYCSGEPCKGICKTCSYGSNWEWKGGSA